MHPHPGTSHDMSHDTHLGDVCAPERVGGQVQDALGLVHDCHPASCYGRRPSTVTYSVAAPPTPARHIMHLPYSNSKVQVALFEG